MSQFSWCRSLKPTARWWFSRTDSSLYMRASSESEGGVIAMRVLTRMEVQNCGCVFPLTGIDEELIRNSGMIDIMDGCSEQSGQDLQISKNCL